MCRVRGGGDGLEEEWLLGKERGFLRLAISVHSGCYNKIPQTGWIINNRHLFLIVLEAGKPKIQGTSTSVSGKNLLPGSQTALVLTRQNR